MSKKKSGSNNKVILMLLGILLICFVVLGLVFYKYFYSGASSNKYGDRLIDIDKYKLSDTLEKDINDLYTEDETIDKVSVDVEGKIVYIMFYFKEIISTTDARDKAIKALESIGEDNLTYYDVQFILNLKKESEDENEEDTTYSIFGSKSSNSNKVVW